MRPFATGVPGRIGLLIGVLILAGLALYLGMHLPTRAPESSSIREERAKMIQNIKREGPAAASRAFVEEYKQKSFSLQHNAAHLFGESLYDAAGLAGIAACDTSFDYGCYHGFLTEAVAAKGLGVVSKLTDACQGTAIPAACEHGIGHGIIEYLGHDPAKLVQALEACDLTHPKDPIAGCRTGLFMEYNIPIVFADDGTASINARLLTDATKPYDPCPSLASSYQLACYYSLPQWWIEVYGNIPDTLKRLCAAVPGGESNQLACATGLGSVSGQASHYDPVKAVAYCRPGLPGRLEERCLTSSAQGFHADIGDDIGADRICALLPASLQKECTF